MSKARTLANLISDNAELADGQISVAEVVGAAPLANPTFTGTASGTFSGPLTGDVTGNVTGNLTGDLTGNVTGDVTGDVTGEVTASKINSTEALPTIRPSLLLDFANSKTLDPRITFTRGSTATYWDGKTTAKAEENLNQYSQEFDNSYHVKQALTITANSTTAPDGTTTADTATGNGGVSYINLGQDPLPTANSTDYTKSIYAKAGTGNWLWIEDYDNGNKIAYYDLANGVLGNVASGVTASIQDVGNGWYRCIHTYAPTSNNNFNVGPANGNGTRETSNSVYLWGMQTEQRSSATAYTPTTSSPIVKYQPTLQTAASGEARFDHDPVTGESKGLLIEEARTNLANWSEVALNFYGGILSGAEMYANAGIAPDGTHTADLVHKSNANEHQSIYATMGGISGNTTYTRSCHFKSRGSRYICLQQYDGVTNYATTYDLQEGAVVATQGSATGTIEDIGNGWFRCSQTFTTASNSNGTERIQIGIPTGANATIQQVGDGWSGVLFWGSQLEQGSFPTSYIPTSGSTVTRSGDQAKVESDFSWFNPMESTIYAEYQSPPSGQTSDVRVLQIQDTGNTSQYAVYFDCDPDGVGGSVRNYILINNTAQMQTTGVRVDAASQNVKSVLAVKENDCAFGANGATVQDDTSARVTTNNFAYMSIGSMSYGANGQYLGGPIKKIAYYPQRLSNATLQAMTEE